MRICYIADGRSIHFHRWIKYSAQHGHKMFFISTVALEHAEEEKVREAGAVYLGVLGLFHVKKFWLTFKSLRWLKRTLRKERIDIVHCHFLSSNTWYAALTGFHPLVITIMGGGDVGPGWKPLGRPQKIMTPYALRRADLITTWSGLLAKVVRPYCNEGTPIEVIHGGIEANVFFPGPKPTYLLQRWNLPDSAKVVFSPRLMRPLSNLLTIAEAASEISAAIPEAFFLFAYPTHSYDDSYEVKVRETLDRNGLADRARFIGAIPHHEMADHFRLADVTVSIASTDGTPMTVLESMACDTPVVVAAIPDYDRHYIEPGKTALEVATDDAAGLARSVVRLLSDPKLAESLVNEARLRVASAGSYEGQMSTLEKCYEALVA